MGGSFVSSLDDLLTKVLFIRESADKEFEGKIVNVEPNGRYYHIEIINDGMLDGTTVFSSYGDLKDYEDVLNSALKGTIHTPPDKITSGPKFKVGDKVKFKLALDLRAIHLEK